MTQSTMLDTKEITKKIRSLTKDGWDSFLNDEAKRQEAKQLFTFETYQLYQDNQKLWDLISELRHNIEGYEELKTLPKGTKLYFVSTSFRSDYNGNHESFNAYYIKDNELRRIHIPYLMKNSKGDYKKVFKRNGGGYGFTFDIAYRISKLITNNKDDYHFKDERL